MGEAGRVRACDFVGSRVERVFESKGLKEGDGEGEESMQMGLLNEPVFLRNRRSLRSVASVGTRALFRASAADTPSNRRT
jgi:hypothetical protein